MDSNNYDYNYNYSNNTESIHHKDPMNMYGLRDKQDQGTGLTQRNPVESQFTTLEHTIQVDTRDCIGQISLASARAYYIATGGRAVAYGTVVNASGLGTSNIILELNSTDDLRVGDLVAFSGIRGNTNANGVQKITIIDHATNTITIARGPNGDYEGDGTWMRKSDHGYPELKENADSTIRGNTMSIILNKELKHLRDISLFHVVIPRDIIPLYYWIPDFIIASVNANNKIYDLYTGGTVTTDYTTRIPQEPRFMASRTLGFYSTPIDLWRTYQYGAFSLQNAVTPPPLRLWNPPGPGVWPNFQPKPYPYQTVPTYKSREFPIMGKTGLFYIVLSGYGVFDLVDWTIISSPAMPITDALNTSIVRRLLLLLLCPVQSYRDTDYIDLILNCSTTSNTDATKAYGFGDFQRYIPGPGHGLTYQPGTNSLYNSFNTTGPPNVPQPDSPIPFPNFRGNVWGPYSSPGDRFQKLGLLDTIQDLYLNGDLNNLLGNPVIVTNVPVEGIIQDPSFGMNFSALIPVTLGNIAQAANLNIINSMRITPNGFGAASVRAEGLNNPGPVGPYFSFGYENAGGIGPSSLGAPSTWSLNPVNTNSGPSLDNPIAQGPSASINTTPATSTPMNNISDISHIPGYYDLGPNNGTFRTSIQNYIGYVVNDIPDNNIIVRIEEALRDERAQSTRPFNGDALLDCPIRLSLGSTSGTVQYVEALQSLLAQSRGYWEQRYLNPKTSLSKLNISFFSYDGRPIPLELMLQPRQVSAYLQLFVKINDFMDINFSVDPFSFNFLFDPVNPQLLGRMKRYISMIFKVRTYQGLPPGNEPTAFTNIPNRTSDDIRKFQ